MVSCIDIHSLCPEAVKSDLLRKKMQYMLQQPHHQSLLYASVTTQSYELHANSILHKYHIKLWYSIIMYDPINHKLLTSFPIRAARCSKVSPEFLLMVNLLASAGIGTFSTGMMFTISGTTGSQNELSNCRSQSTPYHYHAWKKALFLYGQT